MEGKEDMLFVHPKILDIPTSHLYFLSLYQLFHLFHYFFYNFSLSYIFKYLKVSTYPVVQKTFI